MRPPGAWFSRISLHAAIMGGLFWAPSACLSTSKYRIEEHNDGGALAEVDQELLDRVISAFEPHDEACRAEFLSKCDKEALPRCASSPACVEFAECVRAVASPAAETDCADELGTSLDDHWAFEFTRHCWAERYGKCDIGRNFDCVAKYGPPRGDRKEVMVSQQILVLSPSTDDADASKPELSVSFCSELTDCSPPTAMAIPRQSDSIYTVSLKVAGKNFGIGNDWLGYRLVQGRGIDPSVVDSNLPFWGRRVEITRLFDERAIDLLSPADSRAALDALFLQVVDCQSDPAPGISIDLPDSPLASVTYVDASFNPVEAPTVSTGAVGIYGHPLNKNQNIRARRTGADGLEFVGRFTGFVQGGKPHYVRLHPSSTDH